MPDDLLMRHPDPSDASVSTAAEPAAPSVPALPVETLAPGGRDGGALALRVDPA